MGRHLLAVSLASFVWLMFVTPHTAMAQKPGGILRLYSPGSPANMSMLESTNLESEMPLMGIFNGLVMFDQHVAQVSLQSIVPDLATEWSWNENGTELTFKLRQGVKWHDGHPFTAKDVMCTWDLMMDKVPDKLRLNPRKSSYDNLDTVTTTGDYEVTFHLKRPQPAFLMLLASGFSAIYPCHVPASQMRLHPIGTGPFKFVDFKPNEYIRVTRNPDYWKASRPYLDGIEYTIILDRATANLAFLSGKFDMTFPYNLTIPLYNNVRSQMPQATCELTPGSIHEICLSTARSRPLTTRMFDAQWRLALTAELLSISLPKGRVKLAEYCNRHLVDFGVCQLT